MSYGDWLEKHYPTAFFIIKLLFGVLASSQGIINCLIYLGNKPMRSYIFSC